MKRKMTKAQVLKEFRVMIGDSLKGDPIAKREAFNDYTDALCKDGLITVSQYNNWTNPF